MTSNFKPPKLTAAEKRAGKIHMQMVKQLPCIICNAPPPSDAHHCICERYGTRKAPDAETIPLCKACHQDGPHAIHVSKHTWIERNGNDFEYLPEVRRMIEDMALGEWF